MKKAKNITKKQEHFYLKDFFILYNTLEMLKFIGIDEELLKFITQNFDFDILQQCSEYGCSIHELNFVEFVHQEKCFLCFIKLDVEQYIYQMRSYQNEINQAS